MSLRNSDTNSEGKKRKHIFRECILVSKQHKGKNHDTKGQ